MGQISLTNEERVHAIRQFGYTEREATFLCLAALHGGYFLRRQYSQFLDKEIGGTAAALIQKALAKKHAKASTYANNTIVYHLCTRPFYAALGQADNRNRRDRQPSTVKNRLMGLDFVLANPKNHYLATEQEKVDYFTCTLRIERSALPTKIYQSTHGSDATARFFIDKYPIFLPADHGLTAPSVASFCFVDEGLTTVSRLETYLGQYGPLFSSLLRFHVVYVATRLLLFQPAENAFRHFLGELQNGNKGSPRDPLLRRMFEHFEARHLYETNQFSNFDRAKLIRLRDEREAFSGEENEVLYRCWKAGGTRAVLEILAPKTVPLPEIQGTFSTCLLEHNYDLFGSLTAF